MARVLVATQPWGLFWIKTGQRVVQIPLQGEAATINTTVYEAATGPTQVAAFVTNDDGELPGWVEEGDYTLTVNGEDFPVSAVSGSVSGRITAAEGRLTTAEGRLTSLEGRLTTAEANISNLQGRMTTAETDINSLKTRATNLETRATNLETRATNLESRATSLESRMTTAESNISNLQSRMTTAESNISNLQSRMTTAESNISNLQSRMTTAENNIASLQSRMTAVENRATTLENRINRGVVWAWALAGNLFAPGEWSRVSFHNEEYDISNFWNPSTHRYQPSVAGYYRFNTRVQVSGDIEPGTNFQLALYKNGIDHIILDTSNYLNPQLHGSAQFHSNGSTDYFEIWLWNSQDPLAGGTIQQSGGKGISYFQAEGV